VAKIRFPSNPVDGQLFEATSGVFYRFDSRQQTWIRVKNIDARFTVATYLQNGLMSNEDFIKLNGLLLPPPHTTLSSDECTHKFSDGTFGFRSSAEHLFIDYELSLIDRNEKGFKFERREVWQIHTNTYGIDFRINLDKLIAELESRGKLTYRQTMGPQGPVGPKGENGINELDTGPKGPKGIDGINQPFPGSLSVEPNDFETDLSNRGIVDISTQSVSPNENFLIITRANLGDPNFCPKFVKPSNVESKWMLVIDERPSVKQVIRECETEVCGVRSCGPDIRTLPIVQTFCTTRLYYLDMAPIEETIRQRFLTLLTELKETKEKVALEWLKRMIEVYNEQKLALCCALENCQSRRENTRHRQRIEDIRVHAARDGLSVTIDGEDARETVDVNPNCDKEETAGSITEAETSTDGVQDSDIRIFLQCNVHGPNLEQAFIIPSVGPGTYIIEVIKPTSDVIGCCYAHSNIGNSTQDMAVLESVWNDIQGDITKVNEESRSAFRANTPYIGLIMIAFQSPEGRVVKAITNNKHFRTRSEAQEEFWGKSITIEHSGGDIRLFVPQMTALTKDAATNVPPPPSVSRKFGFEGAMELRLVRVAAPEPPPVTSCREGFAVDVTIDAAKNTISATEIPYDSTQPTTQSSVKPQDPFEKQEFFILQANTFATIQTQMFESVIIDLEPGEYKIEALSGSVFDSQIIESYLAGSSILPSSVPQPNTRFALIVTERMHSTSRLNTDFVGAWKLSASDPALTPFIASSAIAKSVDHFNGFLNDLGFLGGVPIHFNILPYKDIAAQLNPYRAFVGISYPDLDNKNTIAFLGDPKATFNSHNGAAKAFVGQSIKIKTRGGKVALFYNNNNNHIGPTMNVGTLKLKVTCEPVKCTEEDEVIVTVPCDAGSVRVSLNPGAYVAELIDCCCTAIDGSSISSGEFDIIYVPADASSTSMSGPLGTTFAGSPQTGFREQGQTPFFRLRGGSGVLLGGDRLSLFGSTVQFNTVDGNIFINAVSTFQQTGALKIKLTPRECFDQAIVEAPAIGTGDDLISDLVCDMHFQHIKQYEFAWNTGHCCGFLVELDGIQWIVVKRSIDQSCGGGERADANCIKEGKALNTHPAIAFPTVDGRNFIGVPKTGFRRMFRDHQLEADLLTKLRGGQFFIIKLIELKPSQNPLDPANTLQPHPITIVGPLNLPEEQTTLSAINNNIIFKFESILFPFEGGN
jgi:hypothetical protein